MFHKNPNIFDILFEAIPEGVIVVDEKRIVSAANSSIEKIFGYKKNELINKPIEKLIPDRFHTTHSNYFNSFLKKSNTRKLSNEKKLIGIKKNKKEFPVEIGLNPFKVNEDTYLIALIIDITERTEKDKKINFLNSQLEIKIDERTNQLNNTIYQLKELNKSYRNEIKKRIEAEKKIKIALKKEKELNELKTNFLSMVSHEFKTPLSGILTSVMLLKKYQLTEQQQNRNKHLKTIKNKVHYLNNILNDFLSIERLDSSKVKYKFTHFNLSKVINEVVYNANLLLKSGQNINIPSNFDNFILYQDEKILELILSNLIYNAIKFSLENTTITIEVVKKGENIQFKIIDQGIGIPEKDQKFIFNRYFRSDNVINTQGTGIGLNIVKSHIENLGGFISFISQENVGSTFTVELPLKE